MFVFIHVSVKRTVIMKIGGPRFELGVSLFYEGMPIDYLNNDRSHDWINLQTKIYTFLTKSPLFPNLHFSEFMQEYSWDQNLNFFKNLHFDKFSTFSKTPLFGIHLGVIWKSTLFQKSQPFQNLHFFKSPFF